PDTVQQTHSGVHLETEIRDVGRSGLLEVFHQGLRYITWKLARSFLVPFRENAFRIKWGKLLLDPILELKIQSYFPVAVVVSQNGGCLARVMIAVVKKKDVSPADLLLQAASRHNFSEQESL